MNKLFWFLLLISIALSITSIGYSYYNNKQRHLEILTLFEQRRLRDEILGEHDGKINYIEKVLRSLGYWHDATESANNQ